jgi:hypothetical protein
MFPIFISKHIIKHSLYIYTPPENLRPKSTNWRLLTRPCRKIACSRHDKTPGPRIYSTSNKNEYHRPKYEGVGGESGGRCVGLTTSSLSVSRLSTHCMLLNIPQHYGPLRPVTGDIFTFICRWCSYLTRNMPTCWSPQPVRWRALLFIRM